MIIDTAVSEGLIIWNVRPIHWTNGSSVPRFYIMILRDTVNRAKGDKLKITTGLFLSQWQLTWYFSEKYPSTVYFAAVAMTISMTVCMNVVMVSKNIIFYHCTNCINFYWTMYLCIRRSAIFVIAIFFLPVHIAFTNLLMKQTCNVLVYMYIYC